LILVENTIALNPLNIYF